MEGPYVERQEQWFVNNPDYMERLLQRANLYLFYIVEAVEKRGMPMEIALLPAIESAYQPHAYSRARASGLWQFIPSTGRLYGLKTNPWYDGRRDVMASTEAALDYLEKLGKDFNGDWHLALAAYNCGEGKVARMMETNQRKGLSTAYQDLKLPRETQQYVPKLMAMVNIVSNPAKYGLQLRDIPNSTYFVQVDAGSQIDLGVVAKLTNVPLDDLYNMNPAFNRWATAPDGPHYLLIPAAAKEVLMEGLSDLPAESRMQWARHEVKRNDTLSRIAYRYGVSPDVIKTANNLQSNQLRVGQDLLIPVSGRKLVITKPNLAPDSKSTTKTTNGKARIIHHVRAGDTLSGIARRYNVYVHQLRSWNLMDADDMLKAGQKLLIWISPASAAAAEKNKEITG
jgi:membrane-bound lytic murein transglycosylase D